MARLRLSSHHLRLETGRFAHVDYINRVCQDPHCMNLSEVQDEQHAVFRCSMCGNLRREHASLFHNADGENMRRFWQGNVNDVSTFVRRCWSYMKVRTGMIEMLKPDYCFGGARMLRHCIRAHVSWLWYPAARIALRDLSLVRVCGRPGLPPTLSCQCHFQLLGLRTLTATSCFSILYPFTNSLYLVMGQLIGLLWSLDCFVVFFSFWKPLKTC